jgi:hypothetical protein
VKPQGKFHSHGLSGQMPHQIILRQTLRNVLLVVIVSLRFGVGCREPLVPALRSSGHSDGCP